jgi:hypothetical protein
MFVLQIRLGANNGRSGGARPNHFAKGTGEQNHFFEKIKRSTGVELRHDKFEGTLSVNGQQYNLPRRTLMERLRKYMGSVIGEVLDDERVNREGLNFLDRMFRHK